MKIFTTVLSLTVLLLCTTAFRAQDGFNDVRCGADIPKALIGHRTTNEKVVAIENRHKDLKLKDLWSEEISDRFSLLSWMICDGEYVLLEDKRSVVRDVLKFPEHSKLSPQFMGACEVNGKSMTGTVVAILNNEQGVEKLSAKAAWKIDEKTAKFVMLPTDGLRCPRDGITTADGGH
jgi:hypothetical protein